MHGLRSLLGLALIVSAFSVRTSRGDIFEEFEGPETSWRMAEAETDVRPLRVANHARQLMGAYAGRGCEFIQLSAGTGTSIYYTHAIPSSRIIPELVPSVWFKSDRTGQQFLARVVFPRSLDKDGKPITSFLAGDSYIDAGSWRQLRIDNLPRKLQREAWSLRTQKNTNVDEREAYIDHLVLNVYAGRGETNLWIDNLGLSVFTSSGTEKLASTSAASVPAPSSTTPVMNSVQNQPAPSTGLQGNVLVAGGKPIFVRAIEHHGETFAFLQSLGFNAVLLTSPATPAQLDEAARTDMWLVAPPPSNAVALTIGWQHDHVLAWFVGEYLSAEQEDRTTALLREIRQQDPVTQRPIVLHLSHDYSRFRHDRGIMMFERSVVGTSFDMANYGNWLTEASLHGRVDAPFWTALATEFPAQLQMQLTMLSGNQAISPCIESDQLRCLAFESVARGARGICFRSRNRLDRPDANTKQRAATLHALNRELELLAPWAAAGKAIGEKTTNYPHVRVFALETSSSRLLIASRQSADQQYVSPPNEKQAVNFTVHGTPFSDQAYTVSALGAEPAPTQRGSAVQISLNELQTTSVVLLTQDPLAVNYVSRVANNFRQEYATCQLEIAESMLAETQQVHEQLNQKSGSDPRQRNRLLQAQADLRQARSLLDSGDARGALQFCSRCLNGAKQVRRDSWESAALNFPSPTSSPLCMTFSTLPLHHSLASHLAQAGWGPNILAAGEMENIQHLLQTGWRQDRATAAHVNMDVRLSLEHPRAGRSSLQLRAWSDESSRRSMEGAWPITITSAPISVRQGQLIRIHGWAKVPQPLAGSSDGLMIFDTITGPALAERISESQGWREFTLYRVATASGELKLVFVHSGLGDSWLDDVSVQVRNEG